MPLLLALMLSKIVLPILAMWKWNAPWRWLAGLPLVVIAEFIARVVIDTAKDPTAHNLWPLALTLRGFGGLLFLGVLWAIRSAAVTSGK